MSALVVIATIKSVPGKEAELEKHLKALVEPSLKDAGCLRYELNESTCKTKWIFTEQWKTRELWDQHLNTEASEQFRLASKNLIEEMNVFTGTVVL